MEVLLFSIYLHSWLSHTKGLIYTFQALLAHNISFFGDNGYHDWRYLGDGRWSLEIVGSDDLDYLDIWDGLE